MSNVVDFGAKGDDLSQDKTLNRILKQVEKIKKMKGGDVRDRRMEEFIRFVLQIMKKRRSDNLLLSTSIWALLSLVSVDRRATVQVMLKAGVSIVLYDIVKHEQLAPPTKKYASDLISILCSGGVDNGSYDDASIGDQSSILKRNFDSSSVHNSASMGSITGDIVIDDDSSMANQTQVSGLYSFAPYHIDDDNVQLMNSLFDENALWRDINDTTLNMHKVGNALDDSVDGGESSVMNGGLSMTNSSTSEFWDSLYQRYNYPEPYKPQGQSVTRQRLESAVRDGGGAATMPSRMSRTAERKSKNASQLYPSLSKRKEPKPLFSLTTDVPVNDLSDHMSDDALHTEAIVPDYLTQLDPLSINVSTTLRSLVRQRLKHEAGDDSSVGAASVLIEGRQNEIDADISNSLDTDLDSLDDGFNNSDETGGEGGGGTQGNVFFSNKVTSNRTRIKAEKLTDMKFIRRMFNEKRMTVTATQELIAKLEDILELMDKDNTGYVTWKIFSRVLVSISPKHLLRADVEAFLDAQVDNEDDLIDYKEFSISGKVMVVENKEGVGQILARSWYSRQKKNKMLAALGDNDPTSTYTWKNHVKWFKKRKSDALIWLMRRANRAIQYYSYVETAQSYLFQVGIFGKALTGLIESGTRALDALDINRNIRIALSKRAIHARDYRRKREEARQFLYYKSHPEVLTPQEAKRKEGLRIQKEIEKHSYKAYSPSISKVYRLIYVTKEATEFLKKIAVVAHEKCRKIDIAYDWLSGLGKRTVLQESRHVETQQELLTMGEKARQYCVHIDQAILGLFRWGEFALGFFDRQDAALKWLLNRAIQAEQFVNFKEKCTAELLHCGKYNLETLNRREEGYAFLADRALRSQDLRRNQHAAVKFLRKIPEKIYANEEFIEESYQFLLGKARHALQHQDRVMRSVKYLMTIASRSVAVTRKRTMAQADLKQIGFQAQRLYFEKLWVPLPGNKNRLRDEIKRINTQDKRIKAVRKNLSEKEKWMYELMDAFSSLASAFSNEKQIGGAGTALHKQESINIDGSSKRPGTSDSNIDLGDDFDDSLEIGRLGFKQLIRDGKMLGLPKGTADASYETVDADGSGAVSFKEVWKWFYYQAKRRSMAKPGSVVVSHPTLVPAKDRAIVALMKRFARQSG